MIQDHPKYAVLMTAIATLIDRIKTQQAAFTDTFMVEYPPPHDYELGEQMIPHDHDIRTVQVKQRHFQGVKIPTTNCDGVTSIEIDVTRKPTDQVETWSDFDSTTFKSKTKIPYNITIDHYSTPEGLGWILTIEIWYAGLDPDEFGHTGNHWIYRHREGTIVDGLFDVWRVKTDGNAE